MMDKLGAILGPLLGIALVAAVGVRDAILLSIIPACSPSQRLSTRSARPSSPRPATADDPHPRPARPEGRPRTAAHCRRRVGAGQHSPPRCSSSARPTCSSPNTAPTPAAQLGLALYTAYNLAATLISVPPAATAIAAARAEVLAAGTIAFALAYLALALNGASIAVLAIAFALAGITINETHRVHAHACATIIRARKPI